MLADNDITFVKIWLHAFEVFRAESPRSEDFIIASPLLGFRHQLPAHETMIIRLLMQAVEHRNTLVSSIFKNRSHIVNSICLCETVAESWI